MIGFLIKGLIRDRSRSLFPVLMIGAGAFLTVTLYSYMEGVMGDMVDSSARFDTGHVKVMTRAYNALSDQMPNDLALIECEDIVKALQKNYPDLRWTPRIKFGGLLDVPDSEGATRSQGPVFGIGLDLLTRASAEVERLNLQRALVRGRLPEKADDILISDAFARRLGVLPGEDATLISSTMNGGMSLHNFTITGTVRFGMVALDRHAMLADLSGIRTALDMEDAAGEIFGFSRDMVYADESMKAVASSFNRMFSNPDDDFSPIMLRLGEQGMLQSILEIADTIGGIIVGIFVAAMSIVLWNAGLMNGLRRYGEIGVRMALGEAKGDLYRAMIYESIFIGIAGSALGTALGLAVSCWLQYVGMDFSSMFQKSTIMVSTVLRSRITPTSYYIGFLPGLFASVIGTMFAGIGIYRRQTSQLFKELEV
jgi:putative ABC transport system permease protein